MPSGVKGAVDNVRPKNCNKLMQDIVKSFPLGVLLRNFFAGVFFILGYIKAAGVPEQIKSIDGSTITLGISVALVSGVTVYAIHRSIFNPLLELIRYSKCARVCRIYAPLMSQGAAKAMLARWDASSNGGAPHKARFDAMNSWADYIHLLYSSSLCLAAGSFLGWLENDPRPGFSGTLLSIGLLMFISGFVSDWRRHYMEEIIERTNRRRTE